jgi:hypothetical protein
MQIRRREEKMLVEKRLRRLFALFAFGILLVSMFVPLLAYQPIVRAAQTE